MLAGDYYFATRKFVTDKNPEKCLKPCQNFQGFHAKQSVKMYSWKFIAFDTLFAACKRLKWAITIVLKQANVFTITYNKIKVQLQFKIQTHMYFTKWMTFFLFSPSRFSPYYIIMRQVSPLYHGTPLNWCNLCLTIAQNHDNYSLKVWWIFIWQQSADELHY